MEIQATTSKQAPGIFPFRRLLRIATALGALVLLFLLLWKLYDIYQLSAEKMYEQSYVPYQIAAGKTSTDSLTIIELYYNEGDHKEVIRQSKNLLSVLDRERLLIGISYLQVEEYLPAISWLNRLAEQDGNPYQQHAQFYLTLTHLKNRDYDRAIELMQLIVDNPRHLYQKRFTQDDVSDVGLLKWK